MKILFIILLLVGCASQIASDIHAPSIPAIATDLHISISQVQFSMAIYMAGFAISQLIYGPLSEGLGRRIPLFSGLLLLFIGSLICLFSYTISILIMGRLIQGCGAGACSVLSRSIFRDKFSGAQLTKYSAYFSIFITFIVPATPIVGGYLQCQFTWRANVIFLLIYLFITVSIAVLFLKETSAHHHIKKLKIHFIFQSYVQIVSNPIFMSYAICSFLCYGAFFSWFTVGPVLLIKLIGINPIEFGYITFFCGGVATAIGGFINGRLVERFGTRFMLNSGFCIMLFSGLLMLMCSMIVGVNTTAIVLPMILFYFGISFTWPGLFSGSLNPFGHIIGYASALYGFMQVSGAAVIGMIVSYLPHSNQMPLSLTFIMSPILAWALIEKIVPQADESC